MKRTPPKRAPKGSIASAKLLKLPAELSARLEREARREGLSASEWIRRAIEAALP
jgi:predicted DNA-binding protein